MKVIRGFAPADRYVYDFGACSTKNGFAQIDTKADASYYGTWCSPERRAIVNYCEGDVTLRLAENGSEFVTAIRELAEWTDEMGYGPMRIDGMCNPELIAEFERLGLGGDLLH